ncbi:MAG: type 4a pilus biogenesis protein PilO [Porticoccaceae bacterium]|nr:type 4a pilus biogenesis protein PilO [Porticoccaceae bacterium]MDG1473639.1 type 4a pilus biogenesis protein PilO [Porticoccaceae bacterium]
MKNLANYKVTSVPIENIFEIKNISTWTKTVLFSISLSLAILLIVLGYFVFVDSKTQALEQIETQQTDLFEEFQRKTARISQKNAYLAQMVELDAMIDLFAEQMPIDTQIPETLTDITMAATFAGLSISQVSPLSSIKKDLYTALPMKLHVSGTYHELGYFLARLTQLKRLVSLHDFLIEIDRTNTEDKLMLTFTIKTYRLDSSGEQL